MMANYDAKNMKNTLKWSPKGSQSEEMEAKESQKDAKRCKREHNGAKKAPKGKQREPNGAKREPKGRQARFTRVLQGFQATRVTRRNALQRP
jgi:hypothetical protein